MSDDVSFDEFVGGIRPPERTIALCTRGDLQAEYESLQRQIDDLPGTWEPGSLSDADPRAKLEAERERLRDEMAAHETVFRFRALSGAAYSQLVAKHSEKGQLNPETWPHAVISACLISPFTVTEDQARQLQDRLSSKQFQDLYECAVDANREGISVPFKRRPSGATSGIGQS